MLPTSFYSIPLLRMHFQPTLSSIPQSYFISYPSNEFQIPLRYNVLLIAKSHNASHYYQLRIMVPKLFHHPLFENKIAGYINYCQLISRRLILSEKQITSNIS